MSVITSCSELHRELVPVPIWFCMIRASPMSVAIPLSLAYIYAKSFMIVDAVIALVRVWSASGS